MNSLNYLLKKGQLVNLPELDEAIQKTFITLQDAILAPLVLVLPKKGLIYSVDTDESDYQIDAALFQNNTRKPVAFFATIPQAEGNFSVSEKNF